MSEILVIPVYIHVCKYFFRSMWQRLCSYIVVLKCTCLYSNSALETF